MIWQRFLMISAVLPAACNDSAVEVVQGVRKDCSLAAIASDYQTSSVALLNADGSVCVEPLVHSGSAGPGLVTALSGDIVFPSQPLQDGHIWVIDRYPNAVLTSIDPGSGATRQISVSTGFASNPQDVIEYGDELWVSRGANNPTPGRVELDTGGDLLILADGVPSRRIDLTSLAVAGFDTMPARLAVLPGERLLVGLAHLKRDFSEGGPGRVAFIDLKTETVSSTLVLEPGQNCGGVVMMPDAAAAVVVCTGVFADVDRAAHSALVVIDLEPEPPVARDIWPAEALVGGPLAFSATPLDNEHVSLLVFGDLGTGAQDQIVIVDVGSGKTEKLGVLGDAFQLGEPLWLAGEDPGGELLIPDARSDAPALRRFGLVLDPFQLTELGATSPTPATGLPPRHLIRVLPALR